MATSDRVAGDQVTVDQVTGDQATGDRATGARTTGDQATGDRATGGRPAATGRRATSAAVAAAAVLWDRFAPTRERPGWREVAIGAVFEAEDVAAAVAGGVGRAARIARLRTPPPTAAMTAARGRLDRLARRGIGEEDRGRLRATGAVDALMTAIATAPMVERVVDAQVDRLLRPLVAPLRDDVLAQLEHDPQRVRALIRGQRESMVDELVGRIRQSTAIGDAAVDRTTARVLRRPGSAPAEPVTPASQPVTPAPVPT